MRILIGIATFKRIEKLKRLLRSLEKQTYNNPFLIHIVCDNNDWETFTYLTSIKEEYKGFLSFEINDKHEFVIGAWNKTIQRYSSHHELDTGLHSWDGFIGLVDDVELRPNAIEEIVKCHKNNFPDTDGVCGFAQECYGNKKYTFKWFGQTLMGKKFIERYKEVNYQICCPDFFHFVQDEEMWEYANSLNKFINCPEAILNHDHPAFTGNIDETHNIIRKGSLSPKNHDFEMQKQRKLKGYLWGRDFNLIGKKELK